MFGTMRAKLAISTVPPEASPMVSVLQHSSSNPVSSESRTSKGMTSAEVR